MPTTGTPDYSLTYALAIDLCSHWKLEKGKAVLSVEDLMKVKEWIATSSNKVLKYPSLLPLASKGLDDLIAETKSTASSSAKLRI